ncbi:MAG: flagellar export chaperone FliS [Firmicutes bacterium]|nr:flagellar export chaperone FliS [Bacillota bacterium]
MGSLQAQYLQTQVFTASPVRLVLLVYQEALRRAAVASGLTDSEHREGAHRAILAVQEAVQVLQENLDSSAGEVAAKMAAIYEYVQQKLVEANMKKEASPLAEVRNILEELRGAWQEIEGKIPA